jgi:hypothetical protein
MAGTRRAADDHSNMNKIYKPVAGYLGNIVKETKEFGSAWKKANNASADIRPGANARARNANKQYDAAKGQLIGALVNKRYDDKGKRK